MLFTHLYETTGHQGQDNLRRLLNAIKNSQDVELIVGNEPVTLTYPEARYLGGQFRAFQKAGKMDEFLRHLVDPVWFDAHMAKLRGMIDRQRALGEMDTNPNDLESDVEREQETQRMTQQDAAAGGMAEDSSEYSGPHGKMNIDRSRKGVTRVTRQGYTTGYVPSGHEGRGRKPGEKTGAGGMAGGGVGAPQKTSFSGVASDSKAGRMMPRLDYDSDDRFTESHSNVQKFNDYDAWRDAVTDQGGKIYEQKNRTLFVATDWSGEELGQFNTRTNQGWCHTKNVAEAANAAQQAAIAINMKKHHKRPKGVAEGSEPGHREIERWATQSEENQKIYNAYIKAGQLADKAYAEKDGAAYTGLQLRRKQIRDLIAKKMSEQGVAEAGPFSYGAKKPRKDSVADLAAKKRQEQEKGKQPAEPQDHMVGVAKVKKDIEEEKVRLDPKCWKGKKIGNPKTKMKGGVRVNNCVPAESVEEDWQKANKRDKTDGMSQKAVNAYRRENPGSKLQTAVTTKPSKLKRGSKASKRRSSYCSRSEGQKKMHHIDCSKTPDKAICKARRRWNCEESVMEGRVKEIAIQYQDYKHLPEMAFQSRYKMSKADWWAKYGKMIQGSGLGIGLNEFAPGDGSDRGIDWTQLVNYLRRTLDSFGFSFEGSPNFAEYSRGNDALTLEYDPKDPAWFGWALGRYDGNFDVLYSGTDPLTIDSAENVLEYVNRVFGYQQRDVNEVRRKPTLSAAERLKKNLKRAGYDMDERERYWNERLKKINQDVEQWNAENPEHQIKKKTDESLRPGEYHHYERDPKTGKILYRGIRGEQHGDPKKPHEYPDDSQARAQRRYDRQEPKENAELPGSQGDWVHGGFKVRFDPATNTVRVFNRNQERSYNWPRTPTPQAYRVMVQQLIDRLEDESI